MLHSRIRNREQAAYELGATYVDHFQPTSASSSATPPSRGTTLVRKRPMSAGSNQSLVHGICPRCTISNQGNNEVSSSPTLSLEFQHRREDNARRRRAMMGILRSSDQSRSVDYEALEDQNQRLKQALNRVTEEGRRLRVTTKRLEEELLRTDRRVDMLLTELEQPPGNR